ncbi:MAG TPA: hypothetical protein DGU45_09490 [Planctomycetes bacterium]|nr:hypothetical protein [Planctomycetota bacterium]
MFSCTRRGSFLRDFSAYFVSVVSLMAGIDRLEIDPRQFLSRGIYSHSEISGVSGIRFSKSS